MIEMRRAQLSFGDGLIADEVDDLCEEWMKHADQVLTDDQIVTAVYEALAKRHRKSRSRGRLGAPAEVVLRLLLLKHVRNWSYQVLEREVRANLVYRDFTRVGAGKTPDAKTMGRWGVALGPEAIKQIHARIVQIAQGNGLVQGRRMRVDTTVVETNIHYPTNSSLLGDGVRVLIRTMRKITKIAGEAGAKLCDRSRSVKLRVLDIARAARAKGKPHKQRLERAYGKLLNSTSWVVGQAKRFSGEIAEGVKRSTDILKQLALEGLRRELDEMLPRVKQVMKQTRARIFRGDTRSEGKLLSLFEPSTEIIRKEQGRQAQRVRQDGQAAGGGESDCHRLRRLRSATRRFGPADCGHGDASSTARSHAAPGGSRRRILLVKKRGGSQTDGRQARLHPKSRHQEPRPQA